MTFVLRSTSSNPIKVVFCVQKTAGEQIEQLLNSKFCDYHQMQIENAKNALRWCSRFLGPSGALALMSSQILPKPLFFMEFGAEMEREFDLQNLFLKGLLEVRQTRSTKVYTTMFQKFVFQ